MFNLKKKEQTASFLAYFLFLCGWGTLLFCASLLASLSFFYPLRSRPPNILVLGAIATRRDFARSPPNIRWSAIRRLLLISTASFISYFPFLFPLFAKPCAYFVATAHVAANRRRARVGSGRPVCLPAHIVPVCRLAVTLRDSPRPRKKEGKKEGEPDTGLQIGWA